MKGQRNVESHPLPSTLHPLGKEEAKNGGKSLRQGKGEHVEKALLGAALPGAALPPPLQGPDL